MPDYKLSYIVTTYNKLPYLQHVMRRLVAARQEDEEIVVCDGGSKDGTTDYLQNLYDTGQIQQYVSERDKGEAHGFNKGMLMARGEIIKIITDDDAFHYPSIRSAKLFMLEHPNVDVLTGNTGLIYLEDLSRITLYEEVEDNFRRWFQSGEVVWMIGLPMIIRRKSLALTGLFHTGMVQVDSEFAFRITSLNINLAWSTALMSIRVDNPKSNYRLMKGGKEGDIAHQEVKRMRFFHDKSYAANYLSQQDESSLLKSVMHWKEKAKRSVLDMLGLKMEYSRRNLVVKQPLILQTGCIDVSSDDKINDSLRVCDEFMNNWNIKHKNDFIFKEETIKNIFK